LSKKEGKLIGIIGGGALGGALAQAIHKQKKKVLVWDKSPKLCNVPDLKAMAEKADVIFICVPSWANREIARELRPYVSKNHVVISLSKGVEKGFVTMDQVLRNELGETGAAYSLLYGPMLAVDIAKNNPTGATLWVSEQRADKKILDALGGLPLQIEIGKGALEVALTGVLKNIYAIGVGVSSGLKLGSSFQALLTIQAGVEMAYILDYLHGDSTAIWQSAGLADLIATGWSETSVNRELGVKVASGKFTLKDRSEGVIALEELKGHIPIGHLPLLKTISQIILEHHDPREITKVI
jgi:glycerol-3-phosphate dehydrogenase (NAD(P)+)